MANRISYEVNIQIEPDDIWVRWRTGQKTGKFKHTPDGSDAWDAIKADIQAKVDDEDGLENDDT